MPEYIEPEDEIGLYADNKSRFRDLFVKAPVTLNNRQKGRQKQMDEGLKKQPTYIVELTENQLRIINDALEEYFRLPLNQWDILADRLARQGIDLSKDNPKFNENFGRYILKRDAVLEVMKSIGRILWTYSTPAKAEEQLIAEDIWQTIRHQLWIDDGKPAIRWTDSQPALNLSNEPLPIIKRASERCEE